MVENDINIESEVEKVIENNPDEVTDYENGYDGALNYLLGQVLQNTNGNADPLLVNEKLEEKLDQ